MRGIKVRLQEGERTKLFLIMNRLIDFGYLVESDSGYVYFPIKKEEAGSEKLAGYNFVNKVFEKNPAKKELKAALSSELSKKELKILNRSYDIIGNIAVLDIPDELRKKEQQVAKKLISLNKNIKTVLAKADIHKGEFRTQKLRYVAGARTKETIHKENNALIKLDVEKVYFSPRLSTERRRIMQQIKPGEKILVMFSGCAPYPAVIAKNTKAKRIVGIEKNRVAHEYGLENIRLNKLNNVDLFCGDVRQVIPKIKQNFDRIIMPLPKDAGTFLDIALKAAKKGTIIHLYLFLDKDDFEAGKKRIITYCEKNNVKIKIIDIVKCGQYSPNTFRVCVDFQLI